MNFTKGKKIFSGTCAVMLISFFSYSQSSPPPYIPNIVPPSPNAATLLKFADVPVSPYTGTADITVPIYTIQAKGLSVPINLSYHTGGVRLKEESGWIGLGWALNAGGSISRTIMDKDDFGGEYFGENVPEITSDIDPQTHTAEAGVLGKGYEFRCDYQVNTTTGTVDFANAFSSATPAIDMEPDIFNYNFPGHSGKFILTRAGNVIMQKQDNIKIEPELDGNNHPNGGAFTITDEHGNVFVFLAKEYVETSSLGSGIRPSSWLMTKITTQLSDSVVFHYTDDQTFSDALPETYDSYLYGCSTDNPTGGTNLSPNSYLNLTLQSIDFANGEIQFSFDGSREDLQNGKRLNAIKIYSKDATGALTYIKEHDFYYSYFNAGQTTSNDKLHFERLKLDSVKEVSGGLSIPAYSFLYTTPFSASLTDKTSYSVDHWGFFNGKSNSSFYPSFAGIVNAPFAPAQTYKTISGANRDVDLSSAQLFSLQKIKYPTGGYTTLAYELNNYDFNLSITGPQDFAAVQLVDTSVELTIDQHGTTTGSIDFSSIYQTIPAGFGTNATMAVTFRANAVNGLNQFRNNNGQIYFTFDDQTIDVSSGSLSCGGVICTTTPPIDIAIANRTTYNWTAFIASSVDLNVFEGITFLIDWKIPRTVQYGSPYSSSGGGPVQPAGGLRVQTITDYNSDNTIAKQRKYTYNSGRLMSFPSYAHYEPTTVLVTPPGGINGTTVTCERLTVSGSSYTAATSSINGNIVGYDTVSEYTVDPTTGADLGKTVYTYYNQSDIVPSFNGFRMPGLLNLGNNLNGELMSKITYANNGGAYAPITETDNFFHVTNGVTYQALKYNYIPLSQTSTGGCPFCTIGSCVSNQFFADFYPSIKSERILLDSTKEIVYDQFDNTKSLATTKHNYYDNPIHFQLTRSSSVDSRGNTHVDMMRYPQDYIPAGQTTTSNTILDNMIDRNMVSEVIEKTDSLYFGGSTTDGKITGAQLNIYKSLTGGSMVMDKEYRLDQTGPVSDFQPFAISGNTTGMDSRYRQLINFDAYDNANNIAQYTPVDQIPVTIIWDYENVYPIAQVKNAMLADVAYTSFEADGSGNWSIGSALRSGSAITGMQSYDLSNGNITKSGLTVGKKYIISYWSSGGSLSVTGGTTSSRTGRTVNNWTYHELTVTTTATTLSLSGNATIDELRLYPVGALMTSYAYTSLVGVVAMNDPNSEITYYEYDALTRLKNIKDYQGNIVKNFQYNYANSCGNNCFVLNMQTLNATNTISYPVGVFDVFGNLIGGANNQADYISVWNSNSNNQQVGTISAAQDSMHFKIVVNEGKNPPAAVTGCRYYQFDLAYNNIDAIRNLNGCYVDFGDGSHMKLGNSNSDSTSMTIATNTTIKTLHEGAPLDYFVYWIHTYPDTSLKTITIFHNDGSDEVGLDNAFSPATSLTKIKNIRGNFPQGIHFFMCTNSQQASANSVAQITNWNTITTIDTLWFHMGDGVAHPNTNISFAQGFMQYNKGLKAFVATRNAYYGASLRDSTFKISRLKTDWNTYFTSLQTLQISDEQWDREDLSGLLNLKNVLVVAANQKHSNDPTNNPILPIPSNVIDSIIIQVSAGAGHIVQNGILSIYPGASNRTSASDAAVSQLQSMGWGIYFDGVLVPLL